MYRKGDGVTKDHARPRAFGSRPSRATPEGINLADAYHHGEGVEKNPDDAEQWYRRAAEQGNSHAASLKYRYPPRDGEQDSRP